MSGLGSTARPAAALWFWARTQAWSRDPGKEKRLREALSCLPLAGRDGHRRPADSPRDKHVEPQRDGWKYAVTGRRRESLFLVTSSIVNRLGVWLWVPPTPDFQLHRKMSTGCGRGAACLGGRRGRPGRVPGGRPEHERRLPRSWHRGRFSAAGISSLDGCKGPLGAVHRAPSSTNGKENIPVI